MSPATHSLAPRGAALVAALGLAALALGYLALWAALAGLPYQDLPNHLARAVVIGDLVFDGGRRFGASFAFQWMAIPYVLGDVLLVGLARVLPPDVAGRAFVALEWAALPLAVAWLTHAWRAPAATRVVALALAFYLATDTPFVLGFANFRLAIALVVAGLAAWEQALATRRAAWWSAYFGLALAGYLMHLSGLVFLIGAVGVLSALRLYERRERLLPLLAAGLPIALLLVWHLLVREAPDPSPPLQPTLVLKVLRLGSSLMRFAGPPDALLCLGFVGLFATVALVAAHRSFTVRERELMLLAVAFFGLYFALPIEKGSVWAIDTRALSLAWLWGALLVAFAAPRLGATRAVAAVAFAIATVNLAVLVAGLVPDDRYMREYRALADRLPPGALVLPVTTQVRHGFLNPTAHAASFATIDRDAIVPYTFAGDLGMPMRYFRFRHRTVAPQQFWYQFHEPPAGGRERFERFPYLLVGLPVDWSRLPLPLEVVVANGAAAIARPGAGTRTAEAGSVASHGLGR